MSQFKPLTVLYEFMQWILAILDIASYLYQAKPSPLQDVNTIFPENIYHLLLMSLMFKDDLKFSLWKIVSSFSNVVIRSTTLSESLTSSITTRTSRKPM